MTEHNFYQADVIDYLQKQEGNSVELIIADPPYSEFPLINDVIRLAKGVTKGPVLLFSYAEDLALFTDPPERVLFWVKPVSTKNTKKAYSRFVEVISCYNMSKAQFNKSHWSIRTGVFTDTLTTPIVHPYQKPISLYEKLILLHSSPGDTILELFSGSSPGSVAAQRLGRNSNSIDKIDYS